MFMFVCFVYNIVPYHESTTLQLCRTAAAVSNAIYVRGHVLTMLRRVACVRACHLSPHHTTRFCCAAAGCACPSMRKHRDLCDGNIVDTNPSLHIYVHRGSFLTSIFLSFLGRSQMTDSRQHAESKTLQVGPCARAVSSLYGGELLLS